MRITRLLRECDHGGASQDIFGLVRPCWQTLAAVPCAKSRLVGSQKRRVTRGNVAHDWEATSRGWTKIGILVYSTGAAFYFEIRWGHVCF